MKTRDRILLKSLALFNEQGERAVTTNHIAAELGISPGNLYYHFANKESIIFGLFLRYSDEMTKVLQAHTDEVLTQERKVALFEEILACMWRYRFLHRDLTHLVSENDEMRQAYQAFAQQVLFAAQAIYKHQAANQLLNASDDEISSLIVNLWIIATSWVNFLTTTGFFGFSEPLTEDMLRQGLYQIMCLEEPYLCGSARDDIAALKARYGSPLNLKR
ncbi:MAG: TetR/AcrR family transcriptional regulator [Moraxellaceae bacterium]|nr:TetR/AcrR family transcriptional regulator [Moraxellaceae bacterium]MDZ4297221.1 TetR/AcrR family transcriptional regulator [Moraxellaceae bacterium]MDZ4386201.1 TetR/AcrR family transcriptional regulator [Moraxellaceae bacterium]